jgi:hypothetical protein
VTAGPTGDAPLAPPDRREMLILVAISLATLCGIAVLAEAGTRVWWPEQERNACYHRVNGVLGRPDLGCTARIKNAEGAWVEMHYNECGYRSPHPCGPKPAGTRRIVVMGTSIAEGLFIPADEQLATRLERDLTRLCGAPVEAQNVATLSLTAEQQPSVMPEVLRLEPDAIILPFAPYDLNAFDAQPPQSVVAADSAPAAPPPSAPVVAAAPPAAAPRPRGFSPLTRIRLLTRDSRALLVAQHFMFANEALLIRAYQMGQEDDALHVPLTPRFVRRYAGVEAMLREMNTGLASRHTPLVVVPVPNRIQAALTSHAVQLPGIDPYAFARELTLAATRAGVRSADPFAAFAGTPHAERLYYVIDGHPTPDAHAILAAAVVRALLADTASAFAGCTATRG